MELRSACSAEEPSRDPPISLPGSWYDRNSERTIAGYVGGSSKLPLPGQVSKRDVSSCHNRQDGVEAHADARSRLRLLQAVRTRQQERQRPDAIATAAVDTERRARTTPRAQRRPVPNGMSRASRLWQAVLGGVSSLGGSAGLASKRHHDVTRGLAGVTRLSARERERGRQRPVALGRIQSLLVARRGRRVGLTLSLGQGS